MDDLISREAAIEALGEEPLRWNNTITEGQEWNDWKYHVNAIKSVPSVPAVPLDKLCEWLAEHSVNIPCETCRHFSNDYCTAIGDMDKPCPNKAEDWQKAIKEWMEGLDDHR